MLNQLARLSLESDGRYATPTDLQFIKDYVATVDHRISAYEKIRDAEYQIMYEVTAQVRSAQPNIFMKGEVDLTTMAQRDCGHVLKCAAAAMLIDDLDRLRDGLLLWHQTIIHAVKTDQISQAMWRILPDVVQRYLSPEEAAIILPVLRLNQALLC
jgi:outer membrane lipopolysaccharide assembly protein LptE/RlpB